MPNATASDDLTSSSTPRRRKCGDYRRPLSVSSTSSAFSSSSSASSSSSSLSSTSTNTSSLSRSHGFNKKSYLASIESLEDGGDNDNDNDNDDEEDDEEEEEEEEEDDEEEEDEGCVTKGPRTSRRVRGTIRPAIIKEQPTTQPGSRQPSTAINCSVISAPSMPQGSGCHLLRPKYCDPNLSHTDKVVLEILDTERTYVRDLHEIIQGYLGHLKDGFPEVEISAEDVDNLFGNVEEIYRFNRDFLAELESCAANPVLVAQAFVRHTKGFAIYTEYCTNYPRLKKLNPEFNLSNSNKTVSVLTDLMRRGKTAEIFKAHQAALGHMLPLGSYLLKPVQRILKYHLLLQNMVKHYVKDVDGYEDVVAALATMTGIACHINDMKRRHEHAVRVQEIQSLLYGWEGQDLTTYGELIAEGTFRMYGAKAVRHVFLFDTMLLVTKKKEDLSLSYKTHIMCSNLMLIESIPGEPLCFHVIPFDNPRVQHTLQARNLEQKREWALQLKRVILENYNVDIPSHARELVMQLGQNRPEDEILVERGNCSSKRNHSAPEYLERRYKHEKERRRMDNINRALRIRRGSKKSGAETPSPLLSPSCDESKVDELHNRSSSCDRNNACMMSNKDAMQRNLSASSLPSQKSKKSRGWRRKSEPCELLSSQESLTSPSSSSNISGHKKLLSKFERSQTSTSRIVKDSSTLLPVREGTTPPLSAPNSADEYVTFFFSRRNRLAGVEAEAEAESRDAHIYEVPCVRRLPCPAATPQTSAGYDNLQNLWPQQLQKQNEKNDVTVQRADSMNSNSDYGSMTMTLNSNATPTTSSSSRPRPDVLDLCGTISSTGEDLDDGAASSPTTPAVWLKQQQSHMAEASLKAGSLPRSFQLQPDGEQQHQQPSPPSSASGSSATDGLGAFKLRRSVDRPFTIASDKPCQSDLNLDDFERYIEDSPNQQRSYRFPVLPAVSKMIDDEQEEDEDDVDEEEEEVDEEVDAHRGIDQDSVEDIILHQVHPENRIYRPSISRSSLRSLLANVGSKLIHLRMQSAKESATTSCSSLDTSGSSNSNGDRTMTTSSTTTTTRRSKSAERDRLTNKLIVSVTHIYSRMIRQRSSLHTCPVVDNNVRRRVSAPCGGAGVALSGSLSSLMSGGGAATIIHKQGSPAIGARMARQMEFISSARSKMQSMLDVHKVPDAGDDDDHDGDHDDLEESPDREGRIVDEVLNAMAADSMAKNADDNDDDEADEVKDEIEARSDVSADSYYERSFEAMESILGNDTCRDSALYSDEPEECQTKHDSRSSAEAAAMSTVKTTNGLRLSASNPEKVFLEHNGMASKALSSPSSSPSAGPVASGRGQGIMETLRHLEQCSTYTRDDKSLADSTTTTSTATPLKSIRERCRELELCRRAPSKAAESDVDDGCSSTQARQLVKSSLSLPSSPEKSLSTRGWVRRVVDKLESDS